MLTLTLFRHAKSSWGDAALRDFDRPLNGRGRDAAPLMGALMRRHGLRPGHILCSPAVRSRQTLDLARTGHPALGEAEFQERLYHATPVMLLRAVHEAPEAAGHVLLVGHNPGLHQLAVWLTGSGLPSRRRLLEEKMPTGAVAVLTFDVARWPDVRPGTGHLRLFARPRDETE
jgi:phosphohistidine phosphatase